MNNENVLMWFDKLLSVNFKGKEVIEQQLKNATFIVEKHYAYIIVEISVPTDVKKFPYNIRVPVRLQAIREGAAPIEILLHIINGYVNELEIFPADSTKIDIDNLKYQKIEYTIHEKLALDEMPKQVE